MKLELQNESGNYFTSFSEPFKAGSEKRNHLKEIVYIFAYTHNA